MKDTDKTQPSSTHAEPYKAHESIARIIGDYVDLSDSRYAQMLAYVLDEVPEPAPSTHVEAAQPVAYRWRWTDSEAWVLTREKPDHVARVVEPLFTAPAPEKHLMGLDEATKQKLREALRFSASRSVMSAEDERRILSALETPAPSSRVRVWTQKDAEREYVAFAEWFKERGYPGYPDLYPLTTENAMHSAWQEAAKRAALATTEGSDNG